MESTGARPFDRRPRQERGHRTRERILAAAERLLRKKRLEDLTIGEIVHAARSSVGSFYHLFGAKEAIVSPLYARYDERITKHSGRVLDSARWRGRDLEYRVGRVIRYAVFLYRHEGRLIRALALHARSHPEQVTPRQKRHRATLYDRLADLLLECRDEIAHPDPESAIRFGLFFVGATCRDKILFSDAPHPHSLDLDDRALATELTGAFLAYLQSVRPRKDFDLVR